MHDLRFETRRAFLRATGLFGGAAAFATYMPAVETAVVGFQAPAPDPEVEKRRAQMGAAPIETTKLAEGVVMLSGPGGNVVVLTGREGKVVVDSFVLPAWPRLKSRRESQSSSPAAR